MELQSSGCGCGHQHSEPTLTVTDLPGPIRHGAILGAISSLKPGASLVLIAPHDPQPLLGEMAAKEGDSITVEYLEQGPEWKLRLTRS